MTSVKKAGRLAADAFVSFGFDVEAAVLRFFVGAASTCSGCLFSFTFAGSASARALRDLLTVAPIVLCLMFVVRLSIQRKVCSVLINL